MCYKLTEKWGNIESFIWESAPKTLEAIGDELNIVNCIV